jgi:hydrogenase nickel incorporation protein HypB
MCTTCGCSDGAQPTLTDLTTGETVSLAPPGPSHSHRMADGRLITHRHDPDPGVDSPAGPVVWGHQALGLSLLAENDRIAAQNRGWCEGRQVLALNLVSSPGAGKTTLLVRTLLDLADRLRFTVIEGLQALNPPTHAVLMIENVGNLVCPALFDLGERAKITILSVAEGEDKPLKYPHMFRASTLLLINKIDLLPYVNFDMDRCLTYARQINPDLQIYPLSATTGEGLEGWYHWLLETAGESG